ncbi:hypothetical protein IQ238_12155 [Pleurocapsales cyanobacterium LEGE 06147]|nr:hypothetical protein [Pleurocapsales cyanobacterium LEGE 06147]
MILIEYFDILEIRAVDTTEQIYRLIEQWSRAFDSIKASEALRQIAITSGCIPQSTKQLSEQENQRVMRWLQQNYPHAYLWAMSQRWVGHPAMVWGSARELKSTSANAFSAPLENVRR